MPMQMTFRWYGEGNDKISLSDIKQIPGVTGIVWALHHKMPGEVWEIDEIAEVKRQLDEYGFNMDVVESVNVHDDIKIGLPTRDKYIENYKQCIRNLSKFGVKVICYNFMPIFDWTRSNLFHPVGDGSTALFYEKGMIQDDYNAMAKYILDFTEKYNMSFPGWEPERMAKLDELFKAYEGVDHEKLWENLKYFLEAIMPTCRECDIKMAIHMDDPPWDIFGLPRLLVDEKSIDRFLRMVDDPYNCLTLCSGSLNANPENNVADIVRKHCDRIAFAHIRNVKHFENGDFSEASHRDCDGDTGILDILKAYHDCGYEGYIRPDHGRHLWSEGPGNVRPGYGLYDRALGIMYMLGVWDMLDKIDDNLRGDCEMHDFSNLCYVAIGDSITKGCSTAHPSQYDNGGYPNIVKDILSLKNVFNYGLAGCQLDAIIAKSHDFVSEANIVSFMGGINDLNNKTSLGSIEDNTVNTFYGRLNLLSKILIEKYPHSFIFYMTPFPSGKEKYNTRNFEGVCLEDYANAVKAVAHNYGIPVFDMYNESQFELEMYNADSDGVHPSEEFLERYTAPKIAEFIRQSYKV